MTLQSLVNLVQYDPGWIVVDCPDSEQVKADSDEFLLTMPEISFRENVYFDSTSDAADKFILVM